MRTALLLSCLFVSPAFAQTVHYHADLRGTTEVPPTGSDGTGTADATFDPATGKLAWKLAWLGLTGPATMEHFHGPAPTGTNAGVTVPLATSPTSPISGTATLTQVQAAALAHGDWYANVHTAAHPKGEIRGQMAVAK